MTLKELMKQADIWNDEFAELMGTSEIAVLKWKAGGGVHPLRLPAFDAVCLAISDAVHFGNLPITPRRMKGENNTGPRTALIKSILNRYLPDNQKL